MVLQKMSALIILIIVFTGCRIVDDCAQHQSSNKLDEGMAESMNIENKKEEVSFLVRNVTSNKTGYFESKYKANN